MSAKPLRHLILGEVDSTNAEGFRRARELDRPFWVVATSQTSGKGRRARAWVSPPGNFYGSLVEEVTEPPNRVALRSFVAAVALREALSRAIGAAGRLALKWPNDVLLNDRKVAGILLEASGNTLCVGIGVNLAVAPSGDVVEPEATPPSSILQETGVMLTPDQLLSSLSSAYASWEQRLVVEGFDPVRKEWLSHAARLGCQIRARTGSVVREGLFETVDASGNLVLRMASGLVVVPAADVFF